MKSTDNLKARSFPCRASFVRAFHRGKVNPKDGQLYVSGMTGWGSYTPDDGCFHRVRYTGLAGQMPVGFHVHENGIMLKFAEAIDVDEIRKSQTNFAQAWNYRYGPGYGSPEMAPSHPGVVGHESVEIGCVCPIDDKTVFVEIPELQPVNQLHLLLNVDSGPPQQLFVTVHAMDQPFQDYPGYREIPKTIAAHPLLQDMALLGNRNETEPLGQETESQTGCGTKDRSGAKPHVLNTNAPCPSGPNRSAYVHQSGRRAA